MEYPIQKELDITEDNLNDLIRNNILEKNELKPEFTSKINSNNLSLILFYFEFDYFFSTKNILSTFYKKENNIYPHIYSPEIYILDHLTNFYFSVQSNFSLTLRWINGEGQINNLDKVNFEFNKNFNGKLYSFSIENITNITCINKNKLSFYLDLNYISDNNVIGEIKIDQITSEIIKNKYFPIYYFIRKSSFNDLDINFKLLDLKDDLTNFMIEGMICKEDIINDLRKGKYINFISNYKGHYDICSKIGLLHIYDENKMNEEERVEDNVYENKDEDEYNEDEYYILIKINSLDSQPYHNVLIEIICLDYYKDKENPNYMPINQFISGTFNLTSKNEFKNTENVFFYITNEERKMKIIKLLNLVKIMKD